MSFLEHVHRDKIRRGSVGGQVVGYILAHWKRLSSWWGEEFVVDRRLAIVNILKKMFSLDSEVCIKCCLFIQPLPSFIFWFQFLKKADSAVVEPVVVMYCTLLEEGQSSLTFKVQHHMCIDRHVGMHVRLCS